MELKEIKVEDILANFYQPREHFEKEKIQELAESILSNGLINPITIREWKGNRFMIVAGERRWRACKIAKLKTIPCIVKEYDNENSFMIESLIENIHREDLLSMEKAKFIKRIWLQMGKPSYRVLGDRLSMGKDSIEEHLSLVADKTPKEVQQAVKKGKLAMRSASMISKLPEREQIVIAKESMKRETGIGRQEVEELIKEKTPEPIKFERTINDIADDILESLARLNELIDEMEKNDNVADLSKSKATRLMTSSGLFINNFKKMNILINHLKKLGVEPDKRILALIKANGKF